MFVRAKYLFAIFSAALFFGLSSDVRAQLLSRLIGGDGLVLDSHAHPYQALTLYVPSSLISSYSLAFPPAPPSGPLNLLVSDANGMMSWANGISLLPPLPPNNIWVGSSLSIATPYAPTVPGAILTLNGSSVPSWSTVIPSNTTVSVSQLTSGTLQPGVTFNVGPNSTIQSTGGAVIANNLNGAGTGKFAGNVPIPANALTLNITYAGIQSGCMVNLNINDPNLPGVSVYLQNITPGVGFTVAFSANYPTNTGVVTYLVINP